VAVVDESQTAMDVYENQCQEAVTILRDAVSRVPTAMELAQGHVNAAFLVNPACNAENDVSRSVPLLPPTNCNPRRMSVSTNGPILPMGKITATDNKADHKSQVLGIKHPYFPSFLITNIQFIFTPKKGNIFKTSFC
jgi:hypothetical protein